VELTSASLLERLQTAPDDAGWRRLVELYTPLIKGWLLRDPALRDEADDLVQDVLAVVVRELPAFRRQRPGSFRAWLRAITAHRLQAHWRSRQRRPPDAGDPQPLLAQLADPASDLSRLWDQEHDRHVARRLLDLIEADFEPATWQAFRQVVLAERTPADVAAELGLTVNAVLLAKSRVLRRLREEGRGLLD
jgi:RNA polymerase sigma-70 factor, ECF subfamily